MPPIAVGLIGTGRHGQRYARHVRLDVPELRLAALSRRDVAAGSAQAEALGARFHADWRALVTDPGVEVVITVVPPSLHPEVARAVAAARKPLLIEKPLATTGAAAREVVATVRGAGIPVLMAHTLRWNVVVRTVRDRLPELGRLHALLVSQRFEPSSLGWLDDPAVSGGGIIIHTGVHSFDLVRWLTGREVARVWCRTARVQTTRTEDNFTALLELEGGGPAAAVNGSRSTGGRSGLIDVAGDHGQLVADHVHDFGYTVQGLTRTALPIPEPVPTVREVLWSFVRLRRDGRPPPASLEDGARAVLIAEACMQAAETGGPAEVGPLACG
jgi:predicted dehydrogenase